MQTRSRYRASFNTLRDIAKDREARLQISRELGHGREQVTSIYLGR